MEHYTGPHFSLRKGVRPPTLEKDKDKMRKCPSSIPLRHFMDQDHSFPSEFQEEIPIWTLPVPEGPRWCVLVDLSRGHGVLVGQVPTTLNINSNSLAQHLGTYRLWHQLTSITPPASPRHTHLPATSLTLAHTLPWFPRVSLKCLVSHPTWQNCSQSAWSGYHPGVVRLARGVCSVHGLGNFRDVNKGPI